MTWISTTIQSYNKTKTKAQMANESRKMAQRLLQAQPKHNPGPPMVKLNRHGKHK
jgi:hypothetical protein